ncbi:hypothetical protein A8990_114109 [Paenibacillus taihuensis]|uniref:Transposase n=1 Tax=Paenibacillus taihuensis TaxID=1156355 RepID=A0A3D9S3R1_9BACL|nr:DUF6262 family protein [Paenibacillus taihuensis]REE84574.1 hypothetical protein A8990_114109 [Paenibacillus taihuensis]
MTKRNTSAIVAMAKDKTSKKVELVLLEIDKMKKKNEKVTFYSISKKTGVSRSFLYNNQILFNKINSIRNNNPRSEDTIQTIVEAQKLKITKLEKEVAELKKNENFKERYEELLAQNKELKKQLEVSYTY